MHGIMLSKDSKAQAKNKWGKRWRFECGRSMGSVQPFYQIQFEF